MRTQFDVVIVGGAITGSVLALALSSATQHKIRIALVEKAVPNYLEQGGFDARSIALAYGSLQKLSTIQPLASGHLAELICKIATPIQQIYVSDQGHFGKTALTAEALKLPHLGVVVELAKLGEQLNRLLNQQPNITLFCPNRVKQLQRTEQKCHLTLEQGQQLESSLVIAADGIQSQLAKKCGVATACVRDYQQSAIIANVEVTEDHAYRAFERFTSQGPFALLPLADKTLSLVWCVQDPSDLMNASDEQFLQALQQQFGWKLGKFIRLSKRFVYPLSLQQAESHIHHRLAIVGNAAQQLHPVAGQGFNLGMRDLFELSNIIAQAFSQGEDIGAFQSLHQFEQQRRQDQTHIINSTNGLISIFCQEWLPVQIARNLALIGLAHCAKAREFVAHQALGWGTDAKHGVPTAR